MTDALVIGAGPAGLMAADRLAQAGRKVIIAEAQPSVGRKLLMAGKSGLNLTKDEDFDNFLTRYGDARDDLQTCLRTFDNVAVQEWARSLGQTIFTGTTGRVFPVAMKSSPLLRAWMARIVDSGVKVRTRWRWLGWSGQDFVFETPQGRQLLSPKVTVLALGGASWPRLGSDGGWAEILSEQGVELVPFAPANAGLRVDWSDHMSRHFGSPVKNVELRAGRTVSKGEFVISATGLEGGGVYELTQPLRDGAELSIDLLPAWSRERIAAKLAAKPSKTTLTNHLRKAFGLSPAKISLLMEFSRPVPPPNQLADAIKSLAVSFRGISPTESAISTAGGVSWSSLDKSLMLKCIPSVFAAGEMLDWEAPTGGYLITGCLATGSFAGINAADWR